MFISLRWKLLGLFTIIIIIAMSLYSYFILETLAQGYLEEKQNQFLTQANIVAGVSGPNFGTEKYLLPSIAREYSRAIKNRVIILDLEGNVLGDSYGNLEQDKLDYDEIISAAKGKTVTNTYYFKDLGWVMYVATPITKYRETVGVAFISADVNDVYAAIDYFREQLQIFALFSGFLVAVLSLFIAHRVVKPLGDLIDGSEAMAKGNLGYQVKVKGNDEVSLLGHAFNHMSKKLEEEDLKRRQFIANASHELRSPLAAIKALSHALLDNPRNNVDIYHEVLQDIDSEVDRLTRLTDDLLSLNREEVNYTSLNRSWVDLEALFKEIMHKLTPLANEQGSQLIMEVSPGLKGLLDQEKIYRAIFNLSDNAVKYGGEGIVIQLKAKRTEDSALIIEVIDNGIGIPSEDQPHIFERFYRVDKARARSTGGNGLGLSIVKEIVENHGGSIDLDSQPDKGTAFRITLPNN